MSKREEVFRPALEGKKIPVLTLDHKWHQIFQHAPTNNLIENLENQLNELLKRQGKLTTDSKDISKLKTKLMNEIVAMMDEISDKQPDKKTEKKLDENKRLINECNEKLEAYQDELLDLPREIDEVNYELMLQTMDACYDMLKENAAEIEEVSEWITQIRRELKKKLIRKQEKEVHTQQIYSYMHDIFGADVIEIFDMKYFPDKLLKKNENEQIAAEMDQKE